MTLLKQKQTQTHTGFKMTDLIATLNRLAVLTIKSHPTINTGGCGVIAAHVAEKLNEKGVKAKIRAVNVMYGPVDLNEERKYLDNPKNMEEWTNNGVCDFYHLLVEFKHKGRHYLYDASPQGVRHISIYRKALKIKGYDMAKGAFKVDEVKAFNNQDGWNTFFNRDEIPTIKRRISRILNQIEVN